MDDSLVLLKRVVYEAIINWNSRLVKIEAAVKKDDKTQRKSESKSNTMSEILEEILNCESHLWQHSLASASEIAVGHDFENLNDSALIVSGKCYLSVPHTRSDITTDSDSDALDDCQYNVINKILLT